MIMAYLSFIVWNISCLFLLFALWLALRFLNLFQTLSITFDHLLILASIHFVHITQNDICWVFEVRLVNQLVYSFKNIRQLIVEFLILLPLQNRVTHLTIIFIHVRMYEIYVIVGYYKHFRWVWGYWSSNSILIVIFLFLYGNLLHLIVSNLIWAFSRLLWSIN